MSPVRGARSCPWSSAEFGGVGDQIRDQVVQMACQDVWRVITNSLALRSSVIMNSPSRAPLTLMCAGCSIAGNHGRPIGEGTQALPRLHDRQPYL